MSQSYHVDNRLADNLRAVQQDIIDCAERSGRDANAIRLIAVSKTRALEEVSVVANLGQCDFAENTIQDAMTKILRLNVTGVQWHFIGHLQSRKAGKIPGHFQWVHSVDSIKLAKKLSAAMVNNSLQSNAFLNCLVQVNVSGEETKSGLSSSDLDRFLQQIQQLQLPGLNWRGLMTLGVKGDPLKTREAFVQLRHLQQSCSINHGLENFDQLSMGMSDDFRIAIEEGATMVRVGSSIFGKRN